MVLVPSAAFDAMHNAHGYHGKFTTLLGEELMDETEQAKASRPTSMKTPRATHLSMNTQR